MPFRKMVCAVSLTLIAAAPAFAWERDDSDGGMVIRQLGDLNATMTGVEVYCPPASGPQVFLIVPEDRRSPLPDRGWVTVEFDGVPMRAFATTVLDGFLLHDDERAAGSDRVNAVMIADMKAGRTMTVRFEIGGGSVPLGSVTLLGFTRAYDAHAAAC